MSPLRKTIGTLTTVAAATAWLIQFMITHWPTPSAVDPDQQENIRRTWQAAADLGAAINIFDQPDILWISGDKVLHIGMFAAISILGMLSLLLFRASRTQVLGFVIAMTAIAVLDEWSQQFVGRIIESTDTISNIIGVVLGVATTLIGQRIWQFLRDKG